MIDINKKSKMAIGIDIGGTNTVIGFVDFDDKIILETSFETQADRGVNEFVNLLKKIIEEEYTKINDVYKLSGIGIAAPSANYLKGTIETAANLNWGTVNIVEKIKVHFGVPVVIINDADAAALGEHKFGIAKGMKNFIVLTLGTGLGSGIFIEGHLMLGENGHAGELGHTIVESKGRECSCGRYDCLETYASANGLKRSVFYFLSYLNEQSELRDISYNQLTGKMISNLANKKDPVALNAFNYTGEILGKSLANMVMLFNPEAIILFGGLADADELLLTPTRFYFEKNLMTVYKEKVHIIKSELQSGKAAVLGAFSFIKDLLTEEKLITEGERYE